MSGRDATDRKGMDRRTFLAAGAAALVAAACGSARKTAAPLTEDNPGLALTTRPPATTTPSTAASTTSAPTTVATTTTVALPVPDAVPSDPNAPEPEIRLGSISIPKLGLDAPLFQGVTLTTLNRGPGHWPGTAMPGQVGNVVVAGHRVTHTRPFRHIDQLAPGDTVVFTVDGAAHTYTMTSNEVVTPDQIRIVEQTPQHTATLFACHPPGSAQFRFVVHLAQADPPG